MGVINDQSQKKINGTHFLMASVGRNAQDVDQWRQPTVLVEERTAECPICFETLWTATPTAFVKLVEGANRAGPLCSSGSANIANQNCCSYLVAFRNTHIF